MTAPSIAAEQTAPAKPIFDKDGRQEAALEKAMMAYAQAGSPFLAHDLAVSAKVPLHIASAFADLRAIKRSDGRYTPNDETKAHIERMKKAIEVEAKKSNPLPPVAETTRNLAEEIAGSAAAGQEPPTPIVKASPRPPNPSIDYMQVFSRMRFENLKQEMLHQKKLLDTQSPNLILAKFDCCLAVISQMDRPDNPFFGGRLMSCRGRNFVSQMRRAIEAGFENPRLYIADDLWAIVNSNKYFVGQIKEWILDPGIAAYESGQTPRGKYCPQLTDHVWIIRAFTHPIGTDDGMLGVFVYGENTGSIHAPTS